MRRNDLIRFDLSDSYFPEEKWGFFKDESKSGNLYCYFIRDTTNGMYTTSDGETQLSKRHVVECIPKEFFYG